MSIDPNPDSDYNRSLQSTYDPAEETRILEQQRLDSLGNERYQLLVTIHDLLKEKSAQDPNNPKIVMLNAQKNYLMSSPSDQTAKATYLSAKLAYEQSQQAMPMMQKIKEKIGSERVSEINTRIATHNQNLSTASDGNKADMEKFVKGDMKNAIEKYAGNLTDTKKPGPLHK